jgi:hypothetical protein
MACAWKMILFLFSSVIISMAAFLMEAEFERIELK